ncbi:protein of unknown function [Candidatus Nitrosocosmicus franklandus]|uniref:Uncharacterized protein n=1 Tax=Candidatus Nitrosocosmicus franklandianus TaxID=1798806 RepID=A0A484I919_9ARCH|nr:protein of unknown function [Candidatus Nitrosocosmicus franklandus]
MFTRDRTIFYRKKLENIEENGKAYAWIEIGCWLIEYTQSIHNPQFALFIRLYLHRSFNCRNTFF